MLLLMLWPVSASICMLIVYASIISKQWKGKFKHHSYVDEAIFHTSLISTADTFDTWDVWKRQCNVSAQCIELSIWWSEWHSTYKVACESSSLLMKLPVRSKTKLQEACKLVDDTIHARCSYASFWRPLLHGRLIFIFLQRCITDILYQYQRRTN